MRADTTLFASLLVASAAAQNLTGPSNSTSIDNSYNKKIVAELEAEVEALKHQLEAAQTETCDASPMTGGSAASPSGSSPAGYSDNKGTTVAPAAVQSSAPAFYTGEDESADKPKPAGYTGQTNTGSSNTGSSNSGASDKPAGYTGQTNIGSDSGVESSSEGTSDAGKTEQDGSYYAPNAPKEGAKSTSTVTVIVTAGTETVHLTQTATRNGTAPAYATGAVGGNVEASTSGDVVIVTATETYCGKGAIPTPGQPMASGPKSDSPAAHASSQLSSVLSATRPASYSSSAPSSVISNTAGYFGNGTAPYAQSSGFVTATRGASSGLELTSSSSMATGISSVVRPVGTGISSIIGTGVIGTLPLRLPLRSPTALPSARSSPPSTVGMSPP
jgi:hypothetical protein